MRPRRLLATNEEDHLSCMTTQQTSFTIRYLPSLLFCRNYASRHYLQLHIFNSSPSLEIQSQKPPAHISVESFVYFGPHWSVQAVVDQFPSGREDLKQPLHHIRSLSSSLHFAPSLRTFLLLSQPKNSSENDLGRCCQPVPGSRGAGKWKFWSGVQGN